MTTAEGWTAAVRDRLAPGRLLPLGTATDGAWITERTVREVLDGAGGAVRGVVPGILRIGTADEDQETGPYAAPGSVRITAAFAAVAGRPLPELSDALRAALLAAAEGGIGLVVAAVDLRVTELLDAEPPAATPAEPRPGRTSPATDDPLALVALGVPGVAGVTDALGPPVRRNEDGVRLELAVTAGRRPLDVARSVRTAVTAAAPEGTAVTVVVSELR
ncbi:MULTISPECIES: hypothetical protein [unclassified Streptomyces]|uniref:hypothetical protein n=1 Tax=unclassified Streptomyces TaxID=2593676 RepID=UPI0006F81B4C|nr:MULTISPECIES: hypothetical protein [unclassified Streptomyces]KQX53585.1 hypothetical protein ASD33_10560 [Streptomyces sp. Root1304]KRA90503.1 hypothetical protein ASE09_10565 [Streptomyces sp. Root66D1]